MSAILSADDLNDFISPGVACIKPVETLPRQQPTDDGNPYEVTTEDRVTQADGAPPAQISLTDCLACSGCVTSAEAVLVSLQSQEEVLSTLGAHPSLSIDEAAHCQAESNGRVFVASISPQARASLAALYNISEEQAGCAIEQLLAGPHGVRSGGQYSSGFTWVVDTNRMREISLAAGIQEVVGQGPDSPKRPVLSSACPGWICYAEKTHPHVLPHLSRLKSPQAMTGTLLKSTLWRQFGVSPSRVWHLAIMPCFDKKLEASREELTDAHWMSDKAEQGGVRDVDCVVTARELLMLAESRGISFPSLPKTRVEMPPFPDPTVNSVLFSQGERTLSCQQAVAGPSGGYAYHVLQQIQTQIPGSTIRAERGRNPDVVEYLLEVDGKVVSKTARYFGFRNIQNLVRKLKPAKQSRLPGARPKALGSSRADQSMTEYAYIEVMACPGGCTNGGGQIKADDLPGLKSAEGETRKATPAEQKQWLARVDEAYYSAESSDDEDVNEIAMAIEEVTTSAISEGHATARYERSTHTVQPFLTFWSDVTGVSLDKLLLTSFRKVESNVGKKQGATSDMDRVAGLASSIGGGW